MANGAGECDVHHIRNGKPGGTHASRLASYDQHNNNYERHIMAMSRKNYTAIATNFGYSLRSITGDDEMYSAWSMVNAFADAAREDNPAFDCVRFRDWVQETADGERDLEGKKVKK